MTSPKTLPGSDTPMLKQYQAIKAQHQDCILFFRLGDFYEMFFEDAKIGARTLDLVLTSRGNGLAIWRIGQAEDTAFVPAILPNAPPGGRFPEANNTSIVCDQPPSVRGAGQ